MNRRLLLPIAVLGLVASSAARAQMDTRMPYEDRFWGYVGASGGQSSFRNECDGIFDCDRKDSAWKAYAGGNFNSILGVEFGYVDFGRMQAFGGDTEARAGFLTLTLGVPLGDRFSVFAKGGGAYGRTDVSAAPAAVVSTGRTSGWGSTWGAGAAFSITKTVQARVDWDRYKLEFADGKRDVDMLSAGLQLRY